MIAIVNILVQTDPATNLKDKIPTDVGNSLD